ncbi:MAG: Hsp20 family protein [bacterium]
MIRRERFSGTAERKFYVGDRMTEEDIQAKFDNGELIITIPKEIPERTEEKKYITIL